MKSPSENAQRILTRFAFIPTKMSNGTKLFWRRYKIFQQYQWVTKFTDNGWPDEGRNITFMDWVTYRKEVA